MEDIGTYQIEIRGQVDEEELNSMSPIQITLLHCEPGCSMLVVRTDQSGMIGLMRHLHGLGFTFLSINYLTTPG